MPKTYMLGSRALRFGTVGLSGVAVNVALLALFHGVWRWPLPLGVVLASELAVLHNFIWNNRWTFGQRKTRLGRLARFNISSLAGLLLAAGITTVLASRGVHYLQADLAGVANGAFFNFAASALWTWKS